MSIIDYNAYTDNNAPSKWSSHLMFVFAASGSAVGLGNIWKFPYIVGENGGGAFVLLYLVCLAGLGLPLLMAETLIGQRGGGNPMGALSAVARAARLSSKWGLLGALGGFIAILLLSFYNVVTGWTAIYTLDYALAAFSGRSVIAGGAAGFGAMLQTPLLQLAAASGVTALAGIVTYRGVTGGVQHVMKIVAPLFCILLCLLLALISVSTGKFTEAMIYIFRPDFSALSFAAFGEALGHAFFTLSVGICAMIIYGGYLDPGADVPKLSLTVAAIDTAIALSAAMIVFPIVFAFNLDASAGPGLLFIALPQGFEALAWGNVVGLVFFLMTFLAAFASVIAILALAKAWLMEALALSDGVAATFAAAITWCLSVVVILSMNIWSGLKIAGMPVMDFLDTSISSWLLPACGLGVVIFASRAGIAKMTSGPVRTYLTFCLNYVTPAGIIGFAASKLFGG